MESVAYIREQRLTRGRHRGERSVISDRTQNIFEYLCAVLRDGLASPKDVRRFIADLRGLSSSEAAFLDTAFIDEPLFMPAGNTSTGPLDGTHGGGISPVDAET
jgi:hypothetical protein